MITSCCTGIARVVTDMTLVWLLELPVPLRRIVCSIEQLKLFSMNDPLCYLHLLVKSLNHLIMAMQHQMCPIFLNLGRFPVLSQIRQQAPVLPLANSFMFHLYNHTSQMLWFSGSFLWSHEASWIMLEKLLKQTGIIHEAWSLLEA